MISPVVIYRKYTYIGLYAICTGKSDFRKQNLYVESAICRISRIPAL